MSTLLWRSLLRHLLRHPWQLALAVLGIALGVAVVLAVDLANQSARKSFEQSVERVSGRANYRIVGIDGVPQEVYVRLRLERGLRDSAPRVEGYPALADEPGRRVQLLGLDPLAEAPFQRWRPADGEALDLRRLMLEPDAAVFPPDIPGDSLMLIREGLRHRLRAAGRLQGTAAAGLVIVDIATAQRLLGLGERITQIDLILPEDAEGRRQAAELRQWLPAGLRLERSAERNAATAELSAAFRLNLQALSLLALLVGMFLIYNTMTFAVVQRRPLLGMLRALGAERGELFRVVLGEAVALGLAGTVLGALLGVWLGSGLVGLVTRTIDDLYYTLPLRQFHLEPLSLLKAGVLGPTASALAAWWPAREAAASPPATVLSRATLESRRRAAVPRLALLGLGLLAAGGLWLWLSRGLLAGFFGLFLLLAGCALLSPGLPLLLAWALRRVWLWLPPTLRMAGRSLGRHLSRTGVAVAALSVALAASLGVGVMVDSFRGGVEIWLRQLLSADLYLAPVEQDGTALRPEVVAALQRLPEQAGLNLSRHRDIWLDGHLTHFSAVRLTPQGQAGYRLLAGDPVTAWAALVEGDAVLISEPLAYRRRLAPGDRITLDTAAGPRPFTVVGIFHDYGSEHGRILIDLARYQALWQDPAISTASLYAAPGQGVEALRRAVEAGPGRLQALALRSNRDILELSLAIFDRTFTVTRVLRLLVVIVAFVGILSALLALQLERAREFAVLRAVGLLPTELGRLMTAETALLGLCAGLAALPCGLLLAEVLIEVINRRAFGWTLPFQVDPILLVQTVALAVAAAALAGLYPAWRLARTPPAWALRTE
ncbi:MAG TPA: FtsX-like permease family protein [Candidatus Competibacteraceae bacterium]|nr:FtsX-like permease family protein [Candidatus Competibacteraceae bacterium]